MERRFRITNVSGGRGLVRTPIPFGASSSLPPGTPPGRRRRLGKRGRHMAIVTENALRPLVRYARTGQLLVEALDGEPLPDWLLATTKETEEETPEVAEEVAEEPVEEPVEEPAPETTTGSAEEVDKADLLGKGAKSVIAYVKECDDVDLLCELHELETDGKARKTVLATLEGRVGELE